MRLSLPPIAVLAAALLSPMSLQAPLAAAPAAVTAASEARVIVTFKADAPLGRRYAMAASGAAAQIGNERASVLGQRHGVNLRSGRHVSERTQVMFARGMSSAQLVRQLAADSEVESVVVDQRRRRLAAPNDPLYGNGQPANPGPAVGQWYLRAPSSATPAAINAEGAWAFTTGQPGVVVAVLDTGVRFDHVDLKSVANGGNLLPGYDMIKTAAVAGDGDERDADASDPGDFLTAAEKAANPSVFTDECTVDEHSSWHGTQTASLVAALTDNGIGMASVGRNVRVLPVRVLGKCGGYDSDIQAAMRWAAGLTVPGVPANPNKAAVISMSLGSAGACGNGYPAVISEVMATGATIVAAAGNSAGLAVGLPANCAGVIAVGALRHVGTKVGYSDVGPEIAISAPGGNCVNVNAGEPCLYPIITALNSGITTPVAGGSIYSDGMNPSVGTSFSAPMVAAAAALMLSVQPALTTADLRSLLQATARPFPTTGGGIGTPVCHAPTGTEQGDECYCTTTTCGAGMLDVGAAVSAATGVVAARIDVTAGTAEAPLAAPQAGQPVQLSAAASVAPVGNSIVSAHWVLVDGGGIVTGFDGSADGLVVKVVPSAAGTFTVSTTVVDSAGQTATSTLAVTVAGTAYSSGGGGAVGGVWLLLLLISVIAVQLRLGRAERRGAPRR